MKLNDSRDHIKESKVKKHPLLLISIYSLDKDVFSKLKQFHISLYG